ncbi:hypothetical protein LTR05_007736 [Lithohypha guttulata]|uniref:Uncharacterized protein n=1 Tax=Lithohypha guttulata TaxID=1690604 RepID=A0AAN7SU45_9EURO|nr:hypothetical protein LTR05_007736 [Lithohypha guttulata]
MAMKYGRLDGLDTPHIQTVRSPSLSSDMMSSSAKSNVTSHLVPFVNPPPAYFARGESSDLISTEYDRKVDISQSALTLLNEFSDHVLYCIISTSHSVALGQLKAAVPAVLKPRLGKSALRYAEEELKDYIEDEEAEELYSNQNSVQSGSHFDPDLVWKLARLRCMVYARLGDFEEEDEEEWLEKEQLLDRAAASPAEARQSMAVTPGAAIFLTSIIEYLGEQALHYAAQYAQKRHDNARGHDNIAQTPQMQLAARDADILLDGKDMNHVGRDSPLSRLWRSWRRNTRAPALGPRSLSPEVTQSPGQGSYYSQTTSSNARPLIHPILEEKRQSTAAMLGAANPSHIPLLEADGNSENVMHQQEDDMEVSGGRPMSMPTLPGKYLEDEDTMYNLNDEDTPYFQERSPLRPTFDRTRSNSVPAMKIPFTATPDSPRRENIVPPIEVHDERREPQLYLSDAGYTFSNGTADLESPQARQRDLTIEAAKDEKPLRPKATPSSEELDATVGVLAGALGAVGVHHVGRVHQQAEIDSSRTTRQPLASASIKAAQDSDTVYAPGGRRERPKSDLETTVSGRRRSKDPYEQIKARQLEEHKRYSQQSHEMNTPSIYSHRDHSPRFPHDMRRVSAPVNGSDSPIEEYAPEEDRRDHPEPLYAPTPNENQNFDQQPDYPFVPREPPTSSIAPGSPTSLSSSKYSNTENMVSNEPVPGLPQILYKRQVSVDEGSAGRARGHSKSSSSSSRLLGFTRDVNGRPQTIHQQMAAGDMTDDVRRAHSSTPTSMNKARPETAQSGSSEKRGHLRLRADSDNNIIRGSPEDETHKRSLEMLIKSDETLLVSLTPPVAAFNRDINHTPRRSQTQDLADFIRNTAPPGQEKPPSHPTTRSRNVSMDAGQAPQVGMGQGEHKTVPSSKDIAIQTPPRPASKHKNLIGEPRDAKIDRTNSIRDLADYARSTGPSNDDQLPKTFGNVNVTSAQGEVPPNVTVGTGPSSPKAARKVSNRLQARDPRPSRHAESSALIDFIREGPPRAPGEHRINRHIAPFRTTMDSDDLNGLVSSMPKSSSEGPEAASTATRNNSNTPLVRNEDQINMSAQPRANRQPSSDDGMPRRTRRRVKDPYDLGDSDDDDLLNVVPPSKQTQEESLMDFLRNTAPPPTMTALPAMPRDHFSESKPTLNHTHSMDKLRGLVRNNRSASSATQDTPKPRTYAQTVSAQSRARADSPHLTQTGSKLDVYRPTQATHASHVDRNRASSKQIRASNSMSHRERGSQDTTSSTAGRRDGSTAFDTGDLANFLLSTAPPPAMQQEVQPFIINGRPNGSQLTNNKEGGGFKKFFSVKGKK